MKTRHLSTFVVITLSFLLFKISAFAGTDVWTGGGGSANLFWLSTANWNPAGIPQAGDTLIFTNSVGLINSNNIPGGNFSGLTFATPSGAFTLNGNGVTLANIANLQVVTPETINLPITDNSPGNLNVNVTANGLLNLNNIISGTGNLTNSGAGRVNLTGSNTFTGSLVINGGIVTASQETNLPVAPITPTLGNIIINGGTLQALAGFTINSNRGMAIGPISGSGQGTISVNTEATAPNQYATLIYGGAITNNGGGTGGLTKLGFGNLVLFGTNTYTGTTSNEVGTLTLDFSKPGAPANNIISSNSPLVFGGANAGAGVTNFAQLVVTNSAAGTVSQTFNGTHVTIGPAVIRVQSGSGTANLTLGALDHDAGGVLAIIPPILKGGSGSISTTSTNLNGIIGGWATISDGNTVSGGWTTSTNWACVDGSGNITNYKNFTVYSSGYVSSIMAATNNILIPSTATGTLTNDVDQTNGIYATHDVNTITFDRTDSGWTFQIGVSNILRLGTSGGLLKRTYGTSSTLNFGVSGSSGELTAGGPNIDTPGDIVLTSYQTDNANNNFYLYTPIVNNGAGAVTVVKSGSGYASLAAANSYTGGTYIEGGRLRFGAGGCYGYGPVYIFPGGYTYVNSTTVVTNDFFLSGSGSQQEAGNGAIRYGPNAAFFTGNITLIGDTEIGGQSGGGILGPISGPFKLILGATLTINGDTMLANTNNSWSGGTLITARTNAGVNSLTLSNSEVIPNGFGKGNVTMQGFSSGLIFWDMHGFNETINGLSTVSASGTITPASCIISNGVASTTSTLTLGDNDQSGTFAGILKAGNGTLALTKIGAGVETLAAANTYSGATTISNGVLQLTGSGAIANSANVNINGGTFDVSGEAYTIPSAQTINIAGGTFFINTASSSTTPVNFTNGTLKVAALNGSANLTVQTLNIGGSANVIQVANAPLINTYPSAFPAIKYTTLNGIPAVSGIAPTFSANLPVTGTPPFGGYISNDTATTTLYVVFTNGPVTPLLTWVGLSGGGVLNSTWDFVANDWTNKPGHIQASYADGSLVVFDDSAATNIVNLNAADVYPASITFSNNSVNYTLTGNYGIRTNSLTKQGTGKVILDNAQTSTNDYAGGTLISGGILQVGVNDTGGGVGSGTVNIGTNSVLVFNRNNSVLTVANAISGGGGLLVSNVNVTPTTTVLSGNNASYIGNVYVVTNVTLAPGNANALSSTNGTVTIPTGATLDVSGQGTAANTLVVGKNVTVSGAGVDNVSGAIVNNAAVSQQNALLQVTLAGDTTFGGTGTRWDIRGTNASASLSTGGHAYNLTKVGSYFMSIANATVDTNLNNVDVQGGTLEINGSTTGIGNPAANLNIHNGASLWLYNLATNLNKHINMGLSGGDTTTLMASAGNNTIIGPVTLTGSVNTYGAANSSLTLGNSVNGSGALVKNSSTNTLILSGSANNYSGGTTINDGSFILNGNNTDTSGSELTANTTQTASPVPVIVGGNGTNKGPVDIEDTLWPGVNGTPSTFGAGNGADYFDPFFDDFNGALVLGGYEGTGKFAEFTLGATTNAGGGFNDLVNVNGTFVANGAQVVINPVAQLTTVGSYTLVNATGSAGTFAATPKVIASLQPSRYQFSLSYPTHQVLLTVTVGAGALEWNNAANTGIWDVTNSFNWHNTVGGTNDYFAQLDGVTFDDSIANTTNNTTVTINDLINASVTNALLPGGMTVVSTNNNYSISGPGQLGGSFNIVKSGPSTLTINNSNTFTGTVTVNGGTLQVNNANALGSAANIVTVTNTGTFNINSQVLTNMSITVSGSGAGNGGAIVNNVNPATSSDVNALQNVTLAGNTTFGGNSRWDMRTETGVLSTGGHPYNLTKAGTNYIAFVGVAIDTNLANIDIQSGILAFQQASTSMGNPSSNLTVEAGATLELYNSTTNLQGFTKQFVLNGDGVTANITNENGLSTLNGNMTLNGACVIGTGGTAITNNCIISGSGSLTKDASATLVLTTNETYTGDTTVSAGTLSLTGNASIANSTNINLGGGTIDVSGRVNTTLTLGGQTLIVAGTNSTIKGSLSNAVGSVVETGSSATNGVTLTVSTNIYLYGTTAMKLNESGSPSNDVLSAGVQITYGGTLTVTNISATPLAAGNSFQLFKAATYSGSFSTLNLPTLSAGLAWVNGLITNGTISVVSTGPAPQPHITGISLNGTILTITATNGADNDTYYLLESTNVALPLSQWTPVLTNTFDGSGNINLSTNIVNPNNGQEFYILQAQ